jgi:ABC-2 type transport system permease protein
MNQLTQLWVECRFQLTRTAVRIVLLLALILSTSAVILGTIEVNNQRSNIAQLIDLDRVERTAAWQTNGDWGDIAYAGFHYTYDSPSKLAFAALGQRDILAWQHRIRMLALEGQIHERDTANPDLALLGQFDFALVASVLLPLLVIVLLHDIKAGERSAGREVLLLATAGSSGLWARRALVLSMLLGLCLLLPFWIGAFVSATEATDVLAVTAMCLLYLAFWGGLVWRFGRGDLSAEVTACGLVGVWFLLAIAIPILGRMAIIATTPLPESGEILMLQREVVNGAWDKPKQTTMDAFVATHPEWRGKAEVTLPFEWKWYYAFQQVGDQEAAALSSQYRAGIVAREQAALWLGLISPPLLLQKSLSCLARTDLSAALNYEDNVRAFHEQMRHFYYPLLFSNASYDPSPLQQHPVYTENDNSCAF